MPVVHQNGFHSDFQILLAITGVVFFLSIVIIATGSATLGILIIIAFAVLLFTWFGYLAFTVFSKTSSFFLTAYTFVSTPRLRLYLQYSSFRIKDHYIRWEYLLTGFFSKRPEPVDGEGDIKWFGRMNPEQKLGVYRARYKNAKNMLDYYDTSGIENLEEPNRSQAFRLWRHYQKQLTLAENGMERIGKNMQSNS